MNIPPILKQKCDDSTLIKPVELNKTEDGLSYGKFLMKNGDYTEYFWAHEDHKFLVYETSNYASEPYFVWNFEVGTVIMDAAYFPINGKFLPSS